nr:DNA-processing protein DprA [Leptolyngbya sp. FACHB-17]
MPGFGRKTVQQFLSCLTFSPTNPRELRDALAEVKKNVSHLKVPELAQLEQGLLNFDRALSNAENAGVDIIGIGEPQFPEKLKNIPDPPMILYARGNMDSLKPEQSIAVIGTRSPTEQGRKSGRRIAKRFAEQGLTIVSGLAEGCDTAAHEGCLDAQGFTVAVMAHGLHMIYPAVNRDLADRIVASGGCLVSEYQLGQKPFKSSFVERDRLQSALSSAVLIIETDVKGGTMHTAGFCLEQGRTLACLNYPAHHQSDKSRGNLKLIQEKKAVPLWNPNEIDDFLEYVFNVDPKKEITELRSEKSHEIDLEEVQPTVDADAVFSLNLTLSKNEQEQFVERCHMQGQTPIQVTETLIRQYLKTNVGSRPEELSPVRKADSGQLALSFLEETTQQTAEAKPPSVTMKVSTTGTSLDSDILTQEELAMRLQVSTNTLRTRKKKDDFGDWSSKKDPDGHPWQFLEDINRFELLF